MMKAIVLAGGLGTRLRERVPDVPKPMAPVGGRPFLEYVLDRLISCGVKDIILSVGHRARAITAHFGDSYRGAQLRYAVETEPLGTGGAIVHALRGEEAQYVLVLNGDTYLHIDFNDLVDWYQRTPTEVAMVLRSVPDTSRYGTVTVSDGEVTGFYEKGRNGPGFVNAGVYLLRPDLFYPYHMPETFSLEEDFLQRHFTDLKPKAYITQGYFVDIGVPEDYDRAQRELPHLSR